VRLVERKRSKDDRRQAVLSLTKKGEEAFAELDAAARREIGVLLQRLSSNHQEQLLASMRTVETLSHPSGEAAVVPVRPSRERWFE
jgi:DNA-binding MarR family transcriptional regulator